MVVLTTLKKAFRSINASYTLKRPNIGQQLSIHLNMHEKPKEIKQH